MTCPSKCSFFRSDLGLPFALQSFRFFFLFILPGGFFTGNIKRFRALFGFKPESFLFFFVCSQMLIQNGFVRKVFQGRLCNSALQARRSGILPAAASALPKPHGILRGIRGRICISLLCQVSFQLPQKLFFKFLRLARGQRDE